MRARVRRRAWEGLKPTEVLRKVAAHTRLEFPAQTPHRLKVWGRGVGGGPCAVCLGVKSAACGEAC